jgi:hypothetical protein
MRGPERVEARLYFDRFDAALQRQADNEIRDEYLYISDAVDVLFTESDAGISVLASSTNYATLSRVVLPALRRLMPSPDKSPFIGRPEGDVDGDLFLWLVARCNGDRQLTSQIELYDLRALTAADLADRPARFLRECLISRPAIQAAITEAGAEFGPVKLGVQDQLTELYVDFELRRDGSFTVHRGNSSYDDPEVPANLFGRFIVDDVAFSIVPRLEQAHAQDRAWHTGGRTEFLREVRAMFQQGPLGLDEEDVDGQDVDGPDSSQD